ncbi:dioxygenase [Streptomyces sp. ISL-12]|uniref:dioxygenase family protein n=1 Tax=Streptomyces sp. ISL-12 TaxID=2819177 RepID=UPI001BEAE167|nr:dioxygenase [Streptomyces sp. ISL-12]MBT2412042.1 dioxygenase [Streptomyces sp. ISL-12]
MPQEDPKHEKSTTSRRQVLVAGGAAVAVVGAGGVLASTAFADGSSQETQSADSSDAESCYRLSSEAIEGPYYIDADKIRTDITEDREGIPMTLTIKVIDSVTCKPVRNAAVDIWHCDALGVYSGYESVSTGGGMPSGAPSGAPSGTPTGTPTAMPTDGGGGGGGMHVEPTDDERYLRGTWRTDRQGKVRFTTIFPGWYQGRAVHIHTKVHVDGTWTDDGYEGGHTCHTGQFYFEEAAVLGSAEVEPYSTSTTTRTTLTEDTIYDQSGAAGGLLTLRYDKKKIAKGVAASITVGVDPDATHDGDDAVMPGASASSSASS